MEEPWFGQAEGDSKQTLVLVLEVSIGFYLGWNDKHAQKSRSGPARPGPAQPGGIFKAQSLLGTRHCGGVLEPGQVISCSFYLWTSGFSQI